MSRVRLFFIVVVFFNMLLSCKQTVKTETRVTIVAIGSKSQLATNVTITCDGTKSIRVPLEKDFLTGHQIDPAADCYFEVFELQDTGEKQIFSRIDADYFGPERQYKQLSKGETVSYTCDVGRFYRLEDSKKYKLRIVLKANKFGLSENVVSDWLFV
jgi:hypothetical protein